MPLKNQLKELAVDMFSLCYLVHEQWKNHVKLNPSSQYDTDDSVALLALGWRWNRTGFYSSIESVAFLVYDQSDSQNFGCQE